MSASQGCRLICGLNQKFHNTLLKIPNINNVPKYATIHTQSLNGGRSANVDLCMVLPSFGKVSIPFRVFTLKHRTPIC